MMHKWIMSPRNVKSVGFLLKSPLVERILVVRHPVVRFWSTWNQKFLKGQVIGRDICNRSELGAECDRAEQDEQQTHLASFKDRIRKKLFNSLGPTTPLVARLAL